MKRLAAFVRANTRGFKTLSADIACLATGYGVFDALEKWLGRVIGPAYRFIAEQFADPEGEASGPSPRPGYFRRALNLVLVSAGCVLCSVVFVRFDTDYMGLTLPAMGVTPPVAAAVVEADDAPLSDSQDDTTGSGRATTDAAGDHWLTNLTSYAFILVAMVWGVLFADSWGLGDLLPPFSKRVMWFWRVTSPIALLVVSGLMVAMSLWRIDQLAALQESNVAREALAPASSIASTGVGLARITGGILPLTVVLTSLVTLAGAFNFARHLAAVGLSLLLVVPVILYLFVIPALKNCINLVVNIGHQAIGLVAAVGDDRPADGAGPSTADAGPDVSSDEPNSSQEQAEQTEPGAAHFDDRNWGTGSEGVRAHE